MTYAFRPHPGPQTDFLSRCEDEVLYGGAAGGGKSYCLIGEATRYTFHPKYHGIIFRRTYKQLEEIMERCQHIYPAIGGVWRATSHSWRFPSGARISFGHLQHEDDKFNHQGAEYQGCFFDELTQFSETMYLYLLSRMRSAYPEMKPYTRATTNPGGIGHNWVKKRFRIGTVEPRTPIIEEFVDPYGEVRRRTRVFIPGRLEDNPSLLEADPNYVLNLMQLPELERKRLMDGIWDAFDGQAFPELNIDVHQITFDPEPDWEVFGAFDWGAAKPWIYQLWAVDFDGTLYHFAELYGAREENGEYIDEGTRETDEEIARKILEFERGLRIKPKYRVADPAIWSRRPQKGSPMPGPSPEETMRLAGVHFLKADNERISGRREVHNRLRLGEDGKPSMYIHRRCRGFWQLFPTYVEDPLNPEDILQKDVADHIYDCVRYAVQSRPRRPKRLSQADHGSFQAERRKLLAAKSLAERTGVSMSDAYRRAR